MTLVGDLPWQWSELQVSFSALTLLVGRQERHHSNSGKKTTNSSAIAEGPRDALSQLKSCQLLHNYENHI